MNSLILAIATLSMYQIIVYQGLICTYVYIFHFIAQTMSNNVLAVIILSVELLYCSAKITNISLVHKQINYNVTSKQA